MDFGGEDAVNVKVMKDLKLDGFGVLWKDGEWSLECYGDCVECEGKSRYLGGDGEINLVYCIWCKFIYCWEFLLVWIFGWRFSFGNNLRVYEI